MKKLLLILFGVQLIFSATPVEDLPEFTKVVFIRNLSSANGLKVGQTLNWVIRSINITQEQKLKDKTFYDKFPFGWVQFVKPSDETACLALQENRTFGFKSCALDLGDGKMQTVFSILPTDRGPVQIRSLAFGGGLCLTVPKGSISPSVSYDFTVQDCAENADSPGLRQNLQLLLPPLVESTVVAP